MITGGEVSGRCVCGGVAGNGELIPMADKVLTIKWVVFGIQKRSLDKVQVDLI